MVDTVPEKRPARATTWLDEDMIRQAKIIGSVLDLTISEVIERHLRKPLAREYRQVVLAETKDIGGEG